MKNYVDMERTVFNGELDKEFPQSHSDIVAWSEVECYTIQP